MPKNLLLTYSVNALRLKWLPSLHERAKRYFIHPVSAGCFLIYLKPTGMVCSTAKATARVTDQTRYVHVDFQRAKNQDLILVLSVKMAGHAYY